MAAHLKEEARPAVKRKGRGWLVVLICLLVLLAAAAVAGWMYIDGLAYKICTMEAGGQIRASDFIKTGDPEAFFTEDSQSFDTTVPGEYQVKVQSGFFVHRATLIVQDSIPPTAQASPVRLAPGESCAAEELVCNIADVTAVTAAFQQAPDFSRFGRQSVNVVLTDAGGNTTVVQSEILVSRVAESLDWEAGSPPPEAERFLLEGEKIAYVSDVSALNLNTVAQYELLFDVDGEEYGSVLNVVDTVPPTAQVQDISGYMLAERAASDFVLSVEDATQVTASFVTEPDLSLEGEQSLEIALTDEGGNQTVLPVKLILEADTEPPVIEGVHDLSVMVGESVAYRKNLRVTDNCPDGLDLQIDSGGVNLNQEGVYQAVYTATDLAGNTASATINVTVLAWEYPEDELNSLADGVLAQIINPDMSQMEILTAIYNYVTTNVAYIDHSDKGNWSKAAYEGLANHRGDCYVFACTTKLLLTRAGIENTDIYKSDQYSTHYWNLVNIGDGWYHFDCTPRVDHPRIFMWTDEQIVNYSNNHWHSHDYDRSLFPQVN